MILLKKNIEIKMQGCCLPCRTSMSLQSFGSSTLKMHQYENIFNRYTKSGGILAFTDNEYKNKAVKIMWDGEIQYITVAGSTNPR